jgi:diguanylate cyclase (GGDEF)-like protein
MLVIMLVVLVALAAWLWAAWQQTRSAQLQRMDVTVKLLAAHADHYFAALGHRMEKLARDLEAYDVLGRPQSTLPLLRQFKAGNPDLLGVAVLRVDGQVLATTAAPDGARLPNLRHDPDSRVEIERDLQASGLSINRPQPSHFLKQWVIHARYPVRDRRGQVRYLVQSGVTLEQQQALWRNLGLRADAALGLLREDGYLISRMPDNLPAGKVYRQQNRGGALYEAMRKRPDNGTYEGPVADGSFRLGVYQHLAQQPMVAFLSHERATFVALWWEQVWMPLTLAALVLGLGALAYRIATARYGGRMHAIEERLAEETADLDTLPSSGVREIDTLVAALAQSRDKLRQAAHNRERLLLAAAEAGTFEVRERDGVVIAADRAFLGMLGRSEAEVIGRPWHELVPAEESFTDTEMQELARRVVRVPQPQGGPPRWVAVAEYRSHDALGDSVRHGLAIDVSDRERLLTQVYLQSQRLQALWQLATSRDMREDEKRRLMLRLALDVLGMDAVLVNELRDDHLVVRELADDLRLFHAGQEMPLDDAICRRAIDGRQTLLIPDLAIDPELGTHVIVTGHGLHGFASVPIWEGNRLYGTMAFLRRRPLEEDYSADERAFMELLATWFGQMLHEEQQRVELERLAMSDALTHLLNRRAAEQRFAEELARARRANEPFSIAICDLDHFKLVNDHYGHDVGDQVLVYVADLLRHALREGDWVARWGGEEFIIFLYQSDGQAAYAAMERLRRTLKGRPVVTAHGPIEITASIGIGTFRGQGELASVLSEADGCLYEAKRAGRDSVVLSDARPHGTLWKAGMLQHALADNRVVPAYQVIVDLQTGATVADETLARLVEPDGRILSAGEFVEAAEGINLIHLVDQVIARQAMQRCTLHLATGKAHTRFAHFINLSPQFLARRELVEALLEDAHQYCVQCGVQMEPVKPVVFEITERQMLSDFERLKAELQPLLDFGFRLALDDFGSGYSSFLYLASLPISFLKIEGWMVQNLRASPRVHAMVKSIIALARDQGITTIAECVEDAETAGLLRELGADWAQGWYFGRPQCEVEALAFQPRRMPTTGLS